MTSNNVVLYHDNCNDGFCAAYVFWKWVDKNATFIPVSYGNAPPDNLDSKKIYILDFSYSREILEDIKQRAESLLVIDHHKTAQKELEGLDYCIFDINKSGASLTWDYLTGKSPFPALVLYTEDRDLWRWELPYSKEVNAALFVEPKDFNVWDNLDINDLVKDGSIILKYQNVLVENRVAQARWIMFENYKVPFVNCTEELISETLNVLAKNSPFAIGFFIRNDGNIVYSLRSDENGIDVSEIAKKYGGGGHKHAAGYISNKLYLRG
jgi:uncharacterized protein